MTDLTAIERLGLLLVRPGALLMTAPVFGASFAPPIARIGLLLLITLALAPVVPVPAAAGGAAMTMIAMREMLIGLALAFSIRIVVAGAELAGHLAGFQIGYAYASLVDPQSGARNGMLSALYANVALMVFLAIDGHHQMLQALVASYEALPPGATAGGAAGDLVGLVARTLGAVFVLGIRLAAPVLFVLFVVELILGLLARAAPQLNLMVNAVSVRLLVGLVVLAATIGVVPDVVRSVLAPAIRLAAQIAGVFR
ncbi:MAG TPA: flagellar biosynthetic protein FliR [Vicinamibacterales bacterium]